MIPMDVSAKGRGGSKIHLFCISSKWHLRMSVSDPCLGRRTSTAGAPKIHHPQCGHRSMFGSPRTERRLVAQVIGPLYQQLPNAVCRPAGTARRISGVHRVYTRQPSPISRRSGHYTWRVTSQQDLVSPLELPGP